MRPTGLERGSTPPLWAGRRRAAGGARRAGRVRTVTVASPPTVTVAGSDLPKQDYRAQGTGYTVQQEIPREQTAQWAESQKISCENQNQTETETEKISCAPCVSAAAAFEGGAVSW